MQTHLGPFTSKNAQEPSERLVSAIRAAKESDPGLSYLDVRQATRLAGFKVRDEFAGMSTKPQLWIAVGVLAAVASGAIAFAIAPR